MNSDTNKEADEAAEIEALQRPHEQFPSWQKSQLYDAVTNMYQDCHDDEEIALALSSLSCKGITGQMVNKLRLEAASSAEKLPHDIRKKWIYRFRRLTVNNLVKEYMFMEGKRIFIQAKRELSEEIEYLVQTTTHEKLCVAINDALGRNNISPDLIAKLVSHARSARKIDVFVRAVAEHDSQPVNVSMEQIARKLKSAHENPGKKNFHKPLTHLAAEMLNQPADAVNEDDIELLLEYCRVCDERADMDDKPVSSITKGADIFIRPQSLTEQAISGNGRNFAHKELVQIVEAVRSRSVMPAQDLERLKSYAERHARDIETMRRLGRTSQRTADCREGDEKIKLKEIITLAERHMKLTDVKLFFSDRELSQADKNGINLVTLGEIMKTINNFEKPEAIGDYLSNVTATNHFRFPVERYMETRFKLPG